MARIDIVAPKTYATEANADKAVKIRGFDDLRYFIYKNWPIKGKPSLRNF